MKLEQQVVSLDLSTRLKELGVKQESLYFHRGVSNNTAPEPEKWFYSWGIHLSGFKDGLENARTRYYAAFTVAELGEMLPWRVRGFQLRQVCNFLDAEIPTNQWELAYWEAGHEDETRFDIITADTEADARAKMLIYLLENNLITL